MEKRLRIFAVSWIVVFLAGLMFLTWLPQVQAQGGQGTPIPTQSPDQILAQAQAASDAASKASNDASNAISSVNTMLSFIQVAGLFVGLVTVVTGGLLTAAGIRQIRDY